MSPGTGATFRPLDMEGMQAQKAQLYINLRNTYERLYAHEAENHEENALLRRNLNTYYDEFVMRYDNLNAKHNAKLILMDASGRNMLSLERGENGQFVKADIFDRPVSFSQETLVKVESPEEALSASLNLYGGVNLPYMESLCDLPQSDMLEALKGRVFYNPLAEGYEIADRFIAGNVVQKVADMEGWIRVHGEHAMLPQAKEALEALKAAVPEQIPFEDLDFNFGERWIPTGVYDAYMSRLFDTEVRITYTESLDEYSAKCAYKTMKITDEFLVKGYYRNYDGMNLLKHALHNTCPDMMKAIGKDENGNDIKVRDSEGIQLANAKIDEIRNGFYRVAGGTVAGVQETADGHTKTPPPPPRPPTTPPPPNTTPPPQEREGGPSTPPPQKAQGRDNKQKKGAGGGGGEGGGEKTAKPPPPPPQKREGGARAQADDYRAESQRARDCRDLPQGLSQREDTLRLGEGLCSRQPGPLLQRHQEQRLGLRHHVARPVREDTAVAGVATAHLAGGAGHGGGKPRSVASAGQGRVTCYAEGIGEKENQPSGEARKGGICHKDKDGRCGGLQADGHRPPVHRREPPVQECPIYHPSRPCGGVGQLRRKPEGAEPAVRHPHHSGADGQGFGGDLFLRHDHQQLADGAVPAVQVPAPEGVGETGYPLLSTHGRPSSPRRRPTSSST